MCMHIHAYVNIHTYMCLLYIQEFRCVCTYKFIYVFVYTCRYIHMCIQIYIYTWVCFYIPIYIYN